MGKKWDAYSQAAKAEHQTKLELASTEGGSSQAKMAEATNNARQAEINANALFQEFLNDPEG